MDSSKFLSSFYSGIMQIALKPFNKPCLLFFSPESSRRIGKKIKINEAVKTQEITGSHEPLIHHIHTLHKCDYVPKEILN